MEKFKWPKWLQESDENYQSNPPADRKKVRGKITWWENKNDQLECFRMTAVEMFQMDDLHKMMGDIWGGVDVGILTPDEFALYHKPVFPRRVGEVEKLPHISTLIADRSPFKEFREKYPDMYKTMVNWMWG